MEVSKKKKNGVGGGSARIGGTKEARVKDKNKVLAVAILHFPTSLAVLAPSTLSLSCSWGRGGRRELSCLNVSVYVPACVCVHECRHCTFTVV